MTWDFRFSCTGCGRCCTSSPSLYLNEAAEQSLRIPLRPSLRVEQVVPNGGTTRKHMNAHGWSYDPKSAEKTNKAFQNRQARYATPIKGKVGGRKLVAYLSLSDLSATHLGKCVFRQEDMSCGIYEDRPLMCRAVPFVGFPVGEANRGALEAFASRSGYMCDTGPDADPVVENGKLLDTPYKEARNAVLNGRQGEDISWIPRATKASLFYADRVMGMSEAVIGRGFAEGSGTGFGLPFGFVVFGMFDAGCISADEAATILINQVTASSRMKDKFSDMKLLERGAPGEAVSHLLGIEFDTWGSYLDGHAEICNEFSDILLSSRTKEERVGMVLEAHGVEDLP